MDTIFLLSPEARSRFLRTAARALGCSYICLWSPLYHPSSDFITSKDGWHHEDDSSRPSSSPGSLSRRLFDAYRRSLCRIQCSYVPGWAYKSSLPYVELKDSELMNLALIQVQRQFYQEAGIKTAVFLGCTSGEIELGTTTSSNANLRQVDVYRVFSEDFIQQSQLEEEFIQQAQLRELLIVPPLDHSRPSSSSSSLRSLSVESPEYSSLLLAKAGAPFMPESTPEQAFVNLPHQATRQAFSNQFPFPSAARDDQAVARAMLAVISSNSSSSNSPQLVNDKACRSSARRSAGAFRPYSPAFASRADAINPSLHGQKMIKKVINQSRRMMTTMRVEAARMQGDRPAISNQLHHMISERKRREKLNESFDALRMLLPPGSKKDKASVLANTKNYLNTLKAQISELEERNRLLQMRLRHADKNEEIIAESTEKVDVQISRSSSESTSEAQRINLVVTVRAECSVMDLILDVLEWLKKMGHTTVVAVEASTGSPQANVYARASFTLQVKPGDCDEESFKEAVTKAVDAVVARAAAAPTR